MSDAAITPSDEGRPVVTDEGIQVGVVEGVDGDDVTVRIDPDATSDADVTGDVRAALGSPGDAGSTTVVSAAALERVTGDDVAPPDAAPSGGTAGAPRAGEGDGDAGAADADGETVTVRIDLDALVRGG